MGTPIPKKKTNVKRNRKLQDWYDDGKCTILDFFVFCFLFFCYMHESDVSSFMGGEEGECSIVLSSLITYPITITMYRYRG